LLNKLKLNVFLYNFYTDKIFKVLTFYSRVMVMVSTFMRSCDEEDLRAAMAALQIWSRYFHMRCFSVLCSNWHWSKLSGR